MFKIKYFFITFSIFYTVFLCCNALVEIENLSTTSRQIRNTVSLAADMAIQQAVASDEMFNSVPDGVPDRFGVKNITTIQVADYKDTSYKQRNLFALTYNIKDIDTTRGKEELFKKMYVENGVFSVRVDAMREFSKISRVMGKSSDGKDLNIPMIAQIGILSFDSAGLEGITCLSNNDSIKLYNADYDKAIKAGYGEEAADWLELYSIAKKQGNFTGGYDTYYLAPTNVGVTYLDLNVLQNAFTCNMDLIMRSKSVVDNNTYEDGEKQGLQKQSGVAPVAGMYGEALTMRNYSTYEQYNIIHDKNMVYVKGIYNDANGGYANSANTQAKPVVEYRVINICDKNNEALVRLALGVRGDYETWLSSLGLSPSGERYISVAKVTFFADIMVSYSTILGRQLNSLYLRHLSSEEGVVEGFDDRMKQVSGDLHCILYTDKEKNILNTSPVSTSYDRFSYISGNPMYEYTTYFAIM